MKSQKYWQKIILGSTLDHVFQSELPFICGVYFDNFVITYTESVFSKLFLMYYIFDMLKFFICVTEHYSITTL